jgi:hypothetical protein
MAEDERPRSRSASFSDCWQTGGDDANDALAGIAATTQGKRRL